MIQRAIDVGLPGAYRKHLETMFNAHIDAFRTGMSLGQPATFPLLKLRLVPNAKPAKVRP